MVAKNIYCIKYKVYFFNDPTHLYPCCPGGLHEVPYVLLEGVHVEDGVVGEGAGGAAEVQRQQQPQVVGVPAGRHQLQELWPGAVGEEVRPARVLVRVNRLIKLSQF